MEEGLYRHYNITYGEGWRLQQEEEAVRRMWKGGCVQKQEDDGRVVFSFVLISFVLFFVKIK
jgi:hypothetical protein